MMLIHEAGPGANQAIIKVEGEVDLYSANAFYKSIEEVLAKSDRLLLDLSLLEYLDSSGVGVLIRGLQKAKTTGARLGIAGISGTPLKVLQLSNISSLFTLYPSVATAGDFWN